MTHSQLLTWICHKDRHAVHSLSAALAPSPAWHLPSAHLSVHFLWIRRFWSEWSSREGPTSNFLCLLPSVEREDHPLIQQHSLNVCNLAPLRAVSLSCVQCAQQTMKHSVFLLKSLAENKKHSSCFPPPLFSPPPSKVPWVPLCCAVTVQGLRRG